MKRAFLYLTVALMGLGLLWSCQSNRSEEGNTETDEQQVTKRGSSGKTLELMIVTDKNLYTGVVEQVCDSLFFSQRIGQLRPDPTFSRVIIPPSSFNSQDMFRVHRNIIMIDIKPDNPNKVYRHIDRWASPQVIYDFAAKDAHSFDSMLCRCYAKILDDIYKAEHIRIEKAYNGMAGVEVMKTIEKHFGFHLTFSNEFNIYKRTSDFAWVMKRTKDYDISILIKKEPYRSLRSFDEDIILNGLDDMCKNNIPGPAEGSYMGLEREQFPIEYNKVTLADQYCIETRGLWRTFGDFMGGPYVSYTLTSPDKKELITLMGFVYSPRTDAPQINHRDLLMQCESICYSLRFSDK